MIDSRKPVLNASPRAHQRRARGLLLALSLGLCWTPLCMSASAIADAMGVQSATRAHSGQGDTHLRSTDLLGPSVALAAPPKKGPGKNARKNPPADQGGEHGGEHGGDAGHGDGGEHGAHHSEGIKLLGGATLEDPRTGIIILILNFVVLLFVLEKVLFSNLRNGHVAHRKQVQADLEKATKAKSEAQALLAEVEERMKNLDASVDEILAEAKKRAQSDRERIIEQAVKDAAAIMEAAGAAAQREAMVTRKTIEREVVESAIARAEALLRQKFGDAEQRRSVDAYVSELSVVDLKRVS